MGAKHETQLMNKSAEMDPDKEWYYIILYRVYVKTTQ